eukprot:GHVU01150790.1.p1 GENE.GHVU01150790.1~~GHVU01150790.1.p1  ORF type:complete len:444 (-),score=93.65 GHVU01150790.1:684-2015(-)
MQLTASQRLQEARRDSRRRLERFTKKDEQLHQNEEELRSQRLQAARLQRHVADQYLQHAKDEGARARQITARKVEDDMCATGQRRRPPIHNRGSPSGRKCASLPDREQGAASLGCRSASPVPARKPVGPSSALPSWDSSSRGRGHNSASPALPVGRKVPGGRIPLLPPSPPVDSHHQGQFGSSQRSSSPPGYPAELQRHSSPRSLESTAKPKRQTVEQEAGVEMDKLVVVPNSAFKQSLAAACETLAAAYESSSDHDDEDGGYSDTSAAAAAAAAPPPSNTTAKAAAASGRLRNTAKHARGEAIEEDSLPSEQESFGRTEGEEEGEEEDDSTFVDGEDMEAEGRDDVSKEDCRRGERDPRRGSFDSETRPGSLSTDALKELLRQRPDSPEPPPREEDGQYEDCDAAELQGSSPRQQQQRQRRGGAESSSSPKKSPGWKVGGPT